MHAFGSEAAFSLSLILPQSASPVLGGGMDQLAAYSDDEEDLSHAKADKTTREVDNNGQEEGGSESKGQPLKCKGGPLETQNLMEEKSSVTNADEERHTLRSSRSFLDDQLLRRLAPPPKRYLGGSNAAGPSNQVDSVSSNGQGGSPSTMIDSEWGLGAEKPSEGVDEALASKLAHFHTLKEEQGTHFNQSLNRNRSFRNPHIYSKLVQWVEVEETGSGYSDMIKGGKERADKVWASSKEARQELKVQGGKDAIASLQKRRQLESDERKKKARRDNIDFVGSSSSPNPSTHVSSRSRSEALALAESRADKIREELARRGGSGSQESERHRRREGEGEKDRHRSSHHHRRH